MAVCTDLIVVPGELSLFAFRVAALSASPGPAANSQSVEQPVEDGRTALTDAAEQVPAAATSTARQQFIAAGSNLSPTTLGQMISVNLCVEPGNERWGRHADFERTGNGEFRLRT